MSSLDLREITPNGNCDLYEGKKSSNIINIWINRKDFFKVFVMRIAYVEVKYKITRVQRVRDK